MSEQNQADIVKATKQTILNALCNQIDQQQQNSEGGRLPYGFVAGLVKSHLSVCPWLTRDSINNEMKRRKKVGKSLLNSTAANQITTSVTDLAVIASDDRKRGGRPDGATYKMKQMCELATIAAKYEILMTYNEDKKNAGKKRLPTGHLTKIIARIKRTHSLGADVNISEACIRQRYKKARFGVGDSKPGPSSPLRKYEDEFVQVMIQMARMRQALSPSEGISLINSLIEGTQAQKDLIAFKKKSSYGDSGTVGVGYWRGFKKRNEHLICSKQCQKYELDRDKWTTYANFSNMYDHIYDEMVEAGVATLLDEPEWQDMNGVRCLESDALGCKVTHHLTHPEMCVVMDEVGANTNQKGDGKIGGRLLVCAKGTVPQEKINTKDKHWTLLGLTALNGDAIMCVAIFAGKRPQAVVETGYDVFATQEGKVSEESFFDRNSKGTGKTFPGGPTCIFQGKEVPCLTRWSPKGSITGDILVDIVSTLDTLSVFDRSEGRKPFLLLDGHGSRFALNFVQYVTDPLHEWAVCIGVPYGTSLWQVGDSSEQNGSYKIELARAKNELIKKKSKKQMKLTIEPYEIIPLINSAWSKSFARPLSNRKAIAARGWNPLNRNILLDETLRATMAEGDDRTEHILDIVPSQFVYIPPTTTLTTAAVSTIPASTKCPPSPPLLPPSPLSPPPPNAPRSPPQAVR